MTDRKRRRLLQGAIASLGAGSLARWQHAGAQADRNLGLTPRTFAQPAASPGSLLVAKRRALVIGNSSYGFSPLKNPANDARAISDALRATGFEVTMALDFRRDQMVEAIRAYAQALAADKAVGLFYFAGHGVQLAWRNYLLPVDAKVERMEQIQETCVDVNRLIEGISKAANPMNVVILDACRENPFGADFRVEQKGLSQLDAPPGTLLAYATSPGNVASDGAGANGLYTENLLKEIRVPEAKIEDVFKRVRLAVRRRSNGLQIPWESTSLEEDFWFLPPAELRRQSEREVEAEFKRELELWERIRNSRQPGPFEEYLRLYPSGRFAELAQFHLDRALAQQGEKKIEIVTSAQNPYTQGSARMNAAFRSGDSYAYNVLDFYSRRQLRTETLVVTSVTDSEVVYNDGAAVTDLLGNPVRTPDGRRFSPNQIVPTEYAVGRRWSTRYTLTAPNGGFFVVDSNMAIVGKERLTVPAGTFDCFVVHMRGVSFGQGAEVTAENKFWIAPDRCRRAIASQDLRKHRVTGRDIAAERRELVSFREG